MRKANQKGTILPIIAILLIILVGAASVILLKSGALEQLTLNNSTAPKSPKYSTPTPEIDSDVQKLSQQGTSDEASTIQKDLEDTDLSSLDKELSDIDKELSF